MIHTENKICAVLPFYNEEKYIRNVVSELKKYVDFIIAVDDGSTDSSKSIIKDSDNIEIISHDENMGKGRALKSGFELAIKMKFNYVISIDADLQHPPEIIPEFILEIEKGFDIVIGNRLHNMKAMPIIRKASNKITSFLLSRKIGQKVLDSQSGYRIFRVNKIKEILPKNYGFEAESEMLIYAGRNKLRIGFVDIPTIYNDNITKMKSFKAIIGFIKVLFI